MDLLAENMHLKGQEAINVKNIHHIKSWVHVS